MITQSLDSNLLVEELQLGEQLNQCVHGSRRADFSLMLSMLVEDVRVHSQFTLPQTPLNESKTSDELLRKTFELPAKERLAIAELDDINEFSQAKLIEDNQLETLHLTQALMPKALAFRNNEKHISANVLGNTNLYCQQQHKNQAEKEPKERLAFNAKEWLKAVQTTIVKSPLMQINA